MNLRSLIQPSEILSIELIGTHEFLVFFFFFWETWIFSLIGYILLPFYYTSFNTSALLSLVCNFFFVYFSTKLFFSYFTYLLFKTCTSNYLFDILYFIKNLIIFNYFSFFTHNNHHLLYFFIIWIHKKRKKVNWIVIM